jgi:DNA-binding transcriptional MocR family regulator
MSVIDAIGGWSSGPGALHRKLAAAIVDAIESGAIPAGTRLPSERQFADALVVSRSTVVAAYDAVRATGAVEARHGSGTYVLARPAHRRIGPDLLARSPGTPIFRRMISGISGDDEVISFACATIPGSPAIGDAIRNFDPCELADLLAGTGYLPLGLPALRAAIARLLTADGLPSEHHQVLVTTGAHQAISLCASLLVRPGDVVIVESPTFPGCADAFAAAGARFAALPTDANGVVLDDLDATLNREPVAAIYVMPTFHNPTGSVLSRHRRARLCELAARAGVPVIEDNALAHASLGGPTPPPPVAAQPDADRAPVITVGSLSKALWGGLRVGWLRAPEPWLGRLARRKVAADLGSAIIDQAIAAQLIARLPELEAANSSLLQDRLAGCSELLATHLPEWQWRPPVGGPSLWIRLPMGDASQFAQVALRHGVEVIPGAAFTIDGSFDDHLRLPFTFEPAVMSEAIDRLARAWRAYVPEAGRCLVGAPLGLVV